MKQMVQNKIDLLIRDMGKAAFLSFLHFVVEVMEAEQDIKILMVRRFLDVFLEFEEIVDYLYEGSVKKKGKIITNLSMTLMEEELHDKTILVVDDIRLHGRALEDVCAFLVKQCNCAEENITVKVFADNKDAVKIDSEFHITIDAKQFVNENRWKKISSSIINSLYILGQPYVSHLPYCEIWSDTEEAGIINEFISKGAAEEITTDIQRYYGMHVYLYFMNNDFDRGLTKKTPFVEQNMIRIYVYDKLKKITIVPYAFLKPFSIKGIVSYYGLLCDTKVLPEDLMSEFAPDVESVKERSYLANYLYSMEAYLTSLMIGKKFLADLAIQQGEWNKMVEEYNFGYQFHVELGSLDSLMDNLADKLKGEYADYSENGLQLSLEPEIEGLFAKIRDTKENNNMSSLKIVENYIKLSGRRDEELAEQNQDRMRGIEYLRVRKYLQNAIQDIWKAIIIVIDSGRGTLTVALNEINHKFFIDSLLFAGEQNFSCNESDLIYFIYPLLEYECFYQNTQMSECLDESDMKREKGKIIQLILDAFPALREKASSDEIYELKEKSILQGGIDYYMGRYPVYEKNHKLREILQQTRRYMKG